MPGGTGSGVDDCHTAGTPTVLVVEDDPEVAALYAGFLDDYDVRVAETVKEALSKVDSGVDAVLLDRRLPDGSGDDVLEAIREDGLDCRVAMVTAVEPDFDILDMGFDLYVTKPVSRTRLCDAVATLLDRSEYDSKLRDAAALATKRALLETQKSPATLSDHEEYEALVERLEELDADLTDATESFSSDDYLALFRDIGQA